MVSGLNFALSLSGSESFPLPGALSQPGFLVGANTTVRLSFVIFKELPALHSFTVEKTILTKPQILPDVKLIHTWNCGIFRLESTFG